MPITVAKNNRQVRVGLNRFMVQARGQVDDPSGYATHPHCGFAIDSVAKAQANDRPLFSAAAPLISSPVIPI
jgi:hypothetical protein